MIDMLGTGHKLSLVFNIGYLLELGFELLRKHLDLLAGIC